jgi:2-isopropylmalate synthase
MEEPKRIFIFDTTLRDGEQAPGWAMKPTEKLEMAKALESLKVDVIEAGFPASSDSDSAAVALIAKEIRSVEIAAMARARQHDIDRAWTALKHAANPRINLFISTSDIHLECQLRKSRDAVLEEARQAVAYASSLTGNIELSAMDATRSDRDFLAAVLAAAIRAGARTVSIADTVGFAMPEEFADLIRYLVSSVDGMDRTTLSVHCHDDLGVAVANSLAAVKSGATQVKCTVNGIGERAGNAALEEVVMALHTRKKYFGCETGVDSGRLVECSRLLTSLTGVAVQPNKAIVGANAFAHESGIHQDGILKNKSTYEIIDPASVGAGDTLIILGKHSGRHALRKFCEKAGIDLRTGDFELLFTRFKSEAATKKSVSDADLRAILGLR